jgi:hypothetical protein
MAQKFLQVQPIKLAGSGVNATATSITVQSFQDPQGNNITTSDIGDALYFTLEPNTSREEVCSATTITQNADGTATISGITRNLNYKSPYTQISSTGFPHAGGTLLIVSNNPQLYDDMSSNANDETITGTWTFDADAYPRVDDQTTLPTAEAEFATKAYADSLSIAGAPDSSQTQKGLTEVGTQSEVESGAADGSGNTSAPLVVTAEKHLETWDKVVTTDYEYNNTISVGDVLYLNSSGQWELAFSASAATCDDTFGVALDAGVASDTGKRVQLSGVVTGLSGLTAGIQYISGAGGQLSNSAGTYKKVFGFAPNATTLIIWPQARVEELSGTNSDTTTANLNEAMTFFANTDITGAQAETLTDGSDANALHIHPGPENGTITGATIATATTTDFTVSGLSNQPRKITVSGSIQANGTGGLPIDNRILRFTVTWVGTGNPDTGLSTEESASTANTFIVAKGYDGSDALEVTGIGNNRGKVVLTLNAINSDGFVIRAVTTADLGTYENCTVSDLGYIAEQ